MENITEDDSMGVTAVKDEDGEVSIEEANA